MKTIVPDYYREFSCLAGACRHSCCIGWEIDIDNDTLMRYGSLPEPLRSRVAGNIQITEDGASFCLQGPEERCPFLNENGLCDLILEQGEGILCQICRDHPRFRTDYASCTELGLGLCCEEAARLILTRKEKTGLVVWKEDSEASVLPPAEEEFFILRRQIIELVQDRRMPAAARIHRLCRRFQLPFDPEAPFEDHARFLLTLERMDESWGERLRRLTEIRAHRSGPAHRSWSEPFEQLAVYLLYRHLGRAKDGVSLPRCLTYCVFAWSLIRRLCALWEEENGPLTQEAMLEICRQYSCELEYSDENPNKIISRFYPGC